MTAAAAGSSVLQTRTLNQRSIFSRNPMLAKSLQTLTASRRPSRSADDGREQMFALAVTLHASANWYVHTVLACNCSFMFTRSRSTPHPLLPPTFCQCGGVRKREPHPGSHGYRRRESRVAFSPVRRVSCWQKRPRALHSTPSRLNGLGSAAPTPARDRT